MKNQTQIYIQIVLLYVTSLGLEILAEKVYPFFWNLYLPVVVAANIMLFDELLKVINWKEIKELKDTNKYLYILSLAVLSAGFAIATATFMK